MTYSVKEIFYTLQGEGAQTGRAAVFCRFAGCNLWSGLERDRATAVCRFCDTDFVGTDGTDGGKFVDSEGLATAVDKQWPKGVDVTRKYVVCTGGEPLLQLDEGLVEAFHVRGFQVAVETNGTLLAPAGIDWICVSPKAGAPLRQVRGNELKLVFPQAELDPLSLQHLPFSHFFLQPMDGQNVAHHLREAIRFCREHPQWRLSLQTHKLVGIR
jgi:7-carboxy-7-deazaguanine synthase